jgi:GeoRSP system SPASM domain protein
MAINKKNLSAPLRVYWEIAPVPAGLSEAHALNLAAELVNIRVFFVTLRVVDGPRADLPELAGVLRRGGVRTVASFTDASQFANIDSSFPADNIDLHAGGSGGFAALLLPALNKFPDKPISVSLVPRPDNIGYIRQVINTALDRGLRTFNLVNPDLISGGPAGNSPDEFVLTAPVRAEWKAMLEELLKPLGDTVKLFVHDLFLHKSLALPGLGARVEYAGCQAGDAVAFIGKTGSVYPCASMPVALGDIKETTLRDVWASPARQEVVSGIRAIPAGCASCSEASLCKGGCRGLAWVSAGKDSADPACEGAPCR